MNKYKIIIAVEVIMISLALINCSTDSSHGQRAVTDTQNFRKEDYDLMRKHFASDTILLKSLDSDIESGDSTAWRIRELLTTEYASREKTGLTETEIDALILSYYSMKEVSRRFDEINDGLPQPKDIDSVINAIEKLKREVKRI